MAILVLVVLGPIVLALSLSRGCGDAALPAVDPAASRLRLTSAAFPEGGTIPREFTCDGPNRSPPLEWTGVPESARSLVLLCDDPDAPAGVWSHWVLYDLSPRITSLDPGISPDVMPTLEPKIVVKQPRLFFEQGMNDFGKIGYGGPCPPSGSHRYVFRLYALDQITNLAPGANRATVLRAIEGHVVAAGELMGKYGR